MILSMINSMNKNIVKDIIIELFNKKIINLLLDVFAIIFLIYNFIPATLITLAISVILYLFVPEININNINSKIIVIRKDLRKKNIIKNK